MISMAGMPSRIREGMLLLSGDVLLLFNPLLIDYSGKGAAAISFKEDVQTGKNHGVYLMGENGNVARCLQKQSVETLKAVGAVNESGSVDIDTGAVIFSSEMLRALFSLVSTEGRLDEKNTLNMSMKLSAFLFMRIFFILWQKIPLWRIFMKRNPRGIFHLNLQNAGNVSGKCCDLFG